MRGGYYPVGGASEIAMRFIPVIEKTGGSVLVRAPVKEILLDEEKRKVRGTFCQNPCRKCIIRHGILP